MVLTRTLGPGNNAFYLAANQVPRVIGIVVSHADVASETIGKQLRAIGEWTVKTDSDRPAPAGGGKYWTSGRFELRTFEELHLELTDVETAFDDPDLVVFASRHSGDTGALLSAHHTGNIGAAEFGGDDHQLARAAPNATATVIEGLRNHAPPDYDVCMECTHHGPSSVGAPSLFVEVGSSEEHWEDEDAAEAVARAILALENTTADRTRQLVGIGGNHYAPRFTRIVTETDWAVGHVLADWGLESVPHPETRRSVLEQAIEQSNTEYAVVDGSWPEVQSLLEEIACTVVSETWVRETTGVPLHLVEALEAQLGSVDDGLRLGDPARGLLPVSYAIVEFPTDLRDRLLAIDRSGTMEALEATCLAYETIEDGNRAGARIVLPKEGEPNKSGDVRLPEPLTDAILNILAKEYDTIDVADDTVTATTETFDPTVAQDRGVPEGPKYGQLANGRAVEIDGDTVYPDEVMTTTTATFSLSVPVWGTGTVSG